MLIARYLLKETFKSQLAVFLVLMTIFITQRFVRVLGDASDGDIPASLVLGFLTLSGPVLASLIMPISFYLGIMLAHGRLYVDSEMTVMRACGISEWYVARVMMALAIVMAIITGALTLWIAPSAVENEYQLREKAAKEAGLSALIPGRFQQTGNERAVIFAHDLDTEQKELKRVFLSQNARTPGEKNVHLVYAESGQVRVGEDGSQTLILSGGIQYEGEHGRQDYQIVEFDQYRIEIVEQQSEPKRRKMAAVPTLELLEDDSVDAAAELQWRIALPLSLPFLVLLAVPLSAVDPRKGRFGRMGPAILLYLGYILLLLASRRVLEDGRIPPQLGLWWVHAVILFIGLTLLIKDRKSGVRLRAVFSGRQ